MADSREARASTDQETAPLLQDPESNGSASQTAHGSHNRSFGEHVNAITQEPLTPLTKVLLILTFVLLMLSSVFIGLFAGAQHKLNSDQGDEHHETRTVTTTATATSTATSTQVHTSTVPGGPLPPLPTNAPENTCITPQCVMLSASILESLDESQDPCENFYQFANGGWLNSHEIPTGRGQFGAFQQLSTENKRIIRKLLEAPPKPKIPELPSYDQQLLTKLRGLYTSCTNEDVLDERGIEPLSDIVKVIKRLYRGDSTSISPQAEEIVIAENKEKFGLTAAVAYLHSRGIGALFKFYIDGDVGVDPNLMSLWFSQPDLSLPAKEYYEDESIRKLYVQNVARILAALDDTEETKSETVNVWPPWPWPPWGDDDDHDDKDEPKNKTESAHKLAKQVVKFERKLANASLDLDILYQDPFGTYNPTSFSSFAASLPQLHFSTYFSTMAPRNFPTSVILTSTTYPTALSHILANTPRNVVEAYLVTRAAFVLAPTLGMNTEVWRANRAIEERLQGIKKGQVPDRAEWCVQRVEDGMGFAVGRFFVQETFSGESKEKGTKVITDVIDMFKQSLQNLEWMDKKSADAATEKADAIRVKVGYPLSPDTTSAASIVRYYNLVTIDDKKFFENTLSIAIRENIGTWQKLGKKRDPEEWEMYPSMVNAYFNPPANEIVFPAGILRPPFFSQDWPAYLSYGAFGQVAAHELTHAFDSAGRLYNQQGRLERWWTNATSEGFQKRQACIARQYSNYTVDDGKGGKIHVNGNLTSGENIGDSGFIQAYRAWKAQYSSSLQNGNEYLLPGLGYTQEQLFFIAFGQIWVQTIKPAAAVQLVLTDPHSPNIYRVEGTLYNIPEFAKAFNCPAGAKLNPPPEKQCRLW